jgi:mono/diheme cytochrome c family protein
MKHTIKSAAIVLCLSALMNCETKTFEDISENKTIPEVVTYNKDVKAIIQNNCVVCHSPVGSNPYFPLTDYTATKNTVDNILDRIQRANGDPLKMPQGGTLSPGDINIIKKWKSDGLLEN